MATKTKTTSNARLTRELLETVNDMRGAGILSRRMHDKITLRHLGDAKSPMAAPIAAKDIRAMRQKANLSQAVFARFLNLTVGYVSQLERGAKRPTGAALAMLNVIRRKGIETIL